MNPRDIEQQEDVLVRLMADYDEALADDAPTTGVDESAAEFDPQLAAAWAGAKECLELLDRARRSGGLTSSRLEPSDGAPPPAVAPPQRLGRFVLERELGRGGLGIVYLAHDPQLGRQVALKIPRFEAMLDDDLRRRFLREAEAAARLNHPNLVALHEVGEESSICYLASEYCPGPTLAEWLHEREDRVPLRQAAEIMLALAEAVEHAHSRGVLHRDIKPSNVLLVASGDDAEGGNWSPKLTDFGLAKLLEQEGGDKTRIGALIGTLAYMAPEQAEGRVDDLDARTDVYALGAVLYELLAGTAPYGGQTDVDTLRQLIMHEPVAPHKLRPNVPRDLEAITLKCLARNPAARYATAHGLVADLRRFLEGQPTVARPLSLLEHALKWARRRPAAAALLVGACILPAFLIGGALWVNQRLAQSLREAQTAHQQAKTQARFTLEHVYASDMATAQQAWVEGNLTGTAAILARFEPTSDQADVRNVEWHYLRQLLDGASRVLPGHKGWLAALAYSPDGRWLVSGGNDGIVHLRDSSNRKTRHLWKLPHGDHVNAIAFSPDSQRLAAATEEGLVRRWDVVSGSELAALHGHAGWVADICFSPDGRQIASAGSDHTVRLWDAASGEAAAVLRGHRDIVRKVRFILDGSVVVATSEDQTVRLWRAADGEPIAEELLDLPAKQSGARPTDMAISPDGQTLAVCMTSEFVRLWRIEAPGRLERFADIPHDQVRCVAFSADGRRLLFGTNDCQLSEWDMQQRQWTTVRRGHKRPILVLAVAPRGDEVASGSRDGELRLWEDGSGQAYRSIARLPFNCQRSELDPSNDLWAIGTSTGQITLVEATTGQVRRSWVAHPQAQVNDLHFSTRGDRLVSCSNGHGCRVWDVASDGLVADFPTRCIPKGKVLLTPDGQDLFVVTDQRLELINLATGVVTASLTIPSAYRGLVLSPDANYLAVGGHKGELWILDAQNLQVRRRLEGHSDAVTGLAFSPSGELLCSSSEDRSTWVWDWRQGRQRQLLSGSNGVVARLTFLPDGRSLLANSQEGVIYFWNISTGRMTLQVPLPGVVSGAQISLDGRRVNFVVGEEQGGTSLLGYLPIASE